ncbi:PAC2 family protein [Haloarculaceae archaeon H-GB2-1]|nr:PAC2 family protein [Haloarculaceae archaeon H-GB1-1]MEA5386180.1 PAC2 family protein [Haloarculaceae archaeon H-GB11]MEA5407686.1 PAC2 family protein [Haloarculaceae archaeon H-GB2-1]
MAHVEVHAADVDLESPTLVEGLPGVGLVGKIAADHLISELDMQYYASCHCDGLPEAAVYREGRSDFEPPVRVYADPEHDLLVLQSDVPVSPESADEFAGCVTGWLGENDVTALYLSGLPTDEKADVPSLHGVGTNGAQELLREHDIPEPSENGLVSGPTGALLYHAYRQDLPALGLVVQSSANFPDPEAARVLLTEAIEPVTGVSVDTDSLVEQAEQIRQAKQQLADQMKQAKEESSRAQPTGMYQ